MTNRRKILTFCLSAAGLAVLLAYLNFAVGAVQLSEKLSLVLAFAIGPVAIIGVLDISHRLSADFKGRLLHVATVFLVIAFALLNLMIVVQQSIFAFYKTYRAEAVDDAARESLDLIFQGVNPVQLGIDISFDIFYAVGLIMLSVVLLHLSRFQKILGIYGILSGGGLLVLNLWTFPVPPAEAALMDLGPFTGLFWVALIVSDKAAKMRSRRACPASS